jgi:hypothetical protein
MTHARRPAELPAERPVETRLREALDARASLVTVRDLRPADPPGPHLRRIPLYRRFTLPLAGLGVAAAALAGYLVLGPEATAPRPVPPAAPPEFTGPGPSPSLPVSPAPSASPSPAPSISPSASPSMVREGSGVEPTTSPVPSIRTPSSAPSASAPPSAPAQSVPSKSVPPSPGGTEN